MNVTIDDASPLIGYYDLNGNSVGKWDSNNTGDGARVSYFQESFHATTQDGDYMSFSFNGTAVYVYGAKRVNHASYSAEIDGQTGGGLLFGYASPDEFQVPLFFTENLSASKPHTVVLTNLANQTNPPPTASNPYYLDIDYIVVTVPVPSEKIYTTIYDDMSPSFRYSGFTPYPNNGEQGYFNNTNHLTFNISATMSFAFNGTSVQLFGGVNFDHTNYSVVLDGGLNQVYNGSSPILYPNQSLFLATNLTEGEHTITLTNLGGSTGNALDFDWAVVNSTLAPDIGGNNSTNTTTGSSDADPNNGSSSDTTTKKSSNAGAIAGGVVGGVVALALVAGLIWFFCFKRKRKYQKAKTYDPTLDLNAEAAGHHHLDGAEVAPFPSSSGGAPTQSQLYSPTSHGSQRRDMSETGYSSGALGSAYNATQEQGERPSTFFTPPAAPPSNATSYPFSEEGDVTDGNQYPTPGFQAFPQPNPHSSPNVNPTYPASSSGGTNTDSTPSHDPPSAPRPLGSLKSAVVSLPYTARPPSSDGPGVGADVPQRMAVPGREMDLGPVLHEEDHEVQGTLPPDYQQATQPLPGQRPK